MSGCRLAGSAGRGTYGGTGVLHSLGRFPASCCFDLFNHLHGDDVLADQLGQMEGPGQGGDVPIMRRPTGDREFLLVDSSSASSFTRPPSGSVGPHPPRCAADAAEGNDAERGEAPDSRSPHGALGLLVRGRRGAEDAHAGEAACVVEVELRVRQLQPQLPAQLFDLLPVQRNDAQAIQRAVPRRMDDLEPFCAAALGKAVWNGPEVDQLKFAK
jgi:hypothetical protein